ncbi:MAG: GntR family transcriptional regulator [Dysgonamonadaceae bacterium]|jgi:DNA-binding transcriptional regulator YhcF (GntR family)|nr:GntR family transcriptional regulator [Dysgonamonadaceae bacterium]
MKFSESQAIYLQIAKIMEEKILRKEWKAEERIPSVRDLAVAMEVNPNTAVRAFEILQQKEIIYNKRGIGYFVSENAYSIVKKEWKKNFKEQELPEFFKNIVLLDFSMEEIDILYKQFNVNK